jgi:hypothetical protein
VTVGEVISLIVFMLIGFVPLWFAIRARRRWLRVLLSLVAVFLLPMFGSLLLLAGSGDSIQGGPFPILMMVMSIACGLGAIAALIVAFLPVRTGP